MDKKEQETADLMRQYNHLLKKGVELADVLRLQKSVYGADFDSLMEEFDSIADYGIKTRQDVTLLSKIRDCFPAAGIDERHLVFQYRAMLQAINQASRQSHDKLSNVANYVFAVGVVAFMLFGFNEMLIQPSLQEVYAAMAAPPPDGWYVTRASAFIVAPVFVLLVWFSYWIGRRENEVNRYMKIAMSERRWPLVKSLGVSFRTYLIVSMIRFAIIQKIDSATALDSVRQAIALTYDEAPSGSNVLNLERVVANLMKSNQLDTFVSELSYWEDQALEEISMGVQNLASQLEALNMTAMGLFVGSMIVQIYLWIFGLGGAMG